MLEILTAPDRLATMRAASLRDSQRYTLDNMVSRFVDGIELALGRTEDGLPVRPT